VNIELIGKASTYGGLVKSRKSSKFVIPAKAGIQSFQWPARDFTILHTPKLFLGAPPAPAAFASARAGVSAVSMRKETRVPVAVPRQRRRPLGSFMETIVVQIAVGVALQKAAIQRLLSMQAWNFAVNLGGRDFRWY
jgi:hypothetical protein